MLAAGSLAFGARQEAGRAADHPQGARRFSPPSSCGELASCPARERERVRPAPEHREGVPRVTVSERVLFRVARAFQLH
jgi:hypothetical protein